MGKKSVKSVLVGCSDKKDDYKMYIKEQDKVLLSKDVIFHEEKLSVLTITYSLEDNCVQVVDNKQILRKAGIGKCWSNW